MRGLASNKQVGGERHKRLLAAILILRQCVGVIWIVSFTDTELVHSQQGAKNKKNKKHTLSRAQVGSSITATVQKQQTSINMPLVKLSLSLINLGNQTVPCTSALNK